MLDQSAAGLHRPLLQTGQLPGDEITETQSLIYFPHHNEAPSEVPRYPWKSIFREVLKES